MSKDEQEKKVTKKNNQHVDRKEERNPLDDHEEQMFVDDIPLEDLKIETEQEKNKYSSQDDSQSSNKK